MLSIKVLMLLTFPPLILLYGCQQKNSFESCVDYYRTEAGKRLDAEVKAGVVKPVPVDDRTRLINLAADLDIRDQCKVGN